MFYIRPFSALVAASTVLASALPDSFDTANFDPADIITRDVAVIGGGSSGTYSAISLIDKGKSVIVVEKKNRLGGHAETYTDVDSNTAVGLGVLFFHNISAVNDYFERLGEPLGIAESLTQTGLYFDFRTADPVTPEYVPTAEESLAALNNYIERYNQYPSLANGTILPDPVPEELYGPFGEFMEGIDALAAIPNMYYFNPGVGNILDNPVVEQFKYWSAEMVHSTINGFLGPARHNISQLYAKAYTELDSSSSVLLSSEVVRARRSDGEKGISLVVSTPEGRKLIHAKKLIIAIPPKVEYLTPFDLTQAEEDIFGKFINGGYYVGLVKNSGLPSNPVFNAVQGNTQFTFPYLPAAYSFAPSAVPGLQLVTYATEQTSAAEPLTNEEVQAEIISTIRRLQEQNPDWYVEEDPEFVQFESHSPYNLQVTAEDIKDGFYADLYALQGQRNTHWTGAAWKGQDSSLLWQYTRDIIVPEVLAGLD